MEIIDVNGTKRNAKSIKKVVCKVHDAINGDEFMDKTYIEAQIVGKTGRVWTEWYPFERFVVMNPNLVIENASN